MKILLALVLLLLITAVVLYVAFDGCIATSFRGPGFDPEKGVTAPGAGETVLVAITHGRIGAGETAKFRAQMKQVLADLPTREGLIGFAVRKEIFGNQVWTVSAWTTAEALEAFVYARPHREVIEDTSIPYPSTRFIRRTMPASELPIDWDRVLAILAEESAQAAN